MQLLVEEILPNPFSTDYCVVTGLDISKIVGVKVHVPAFGGIYSFPPNSSDFSNTEYAHYISSDGLPSAHACLDPINASSLNGNTAKILITYIE